MQKNSTNYKRAWALLSLASDGYKHIEVFATMQEADALYEELTNDKRTKKLKLHYSVHPIALNPGNYSVIAFTKTKEVG